MFSKGFFAAAALAGLASARDFYFSVDPITTTDFNNAANDHCVEFTVSNPNAFSEQGGTSPFHCKISWSGADVPQCWQQCQGSPSQYYAKVTPGSYKSAADFSLDIWQAYVYELGNHNNATVAISVGGDNSTYSCGKDGEQNTVCSLNGGEGFNQTETMYYGGADPVGAPKC